MMELVNTCSTLPFVVDFVRRTLNSIVYHKRSGIFASIFDAVIIKSLSKAKLCVGNRYCQVYFVQNLENQIEHYSCCAETI